MRVSLPLFAALLAALSLGLYLLSGAGRSPSLGASEGPEAMGALGGLAAEPLHSERGARQEAQVADVESVPTDAPTGAAPAQAGVSLLITTDWAEAPGSASTLVVEGQLVELRAEEIRQRQARFEDLPGGAWLTVRWMSGRENSFRGLLHEELIQLPTEGQGSLHLRADRTNGQVGHARLSVLTPPELDGSDVDFTIRREGEERFSTSLRSAPWEVPAFGEARANLWRLAAGEWTVHASGLGPVGTFTMDPDRWTDAVVDLRDLAVVRVHVLSAATGQTVRAASVSWTTDGAGAWGWARDLGPEHGHVREAWVLPGPARFRAAATGVDSGVVDVVVLPGSNELILDLEAKVELEHGIVLANSGELQPFDLEAWAAGNFQTLEGDGEVESIRFDVLDGFDKPMASSATLVVSAAGRFRWYLPEALDSELGAVEFTVSAVETTTTTLEVGARNGWGEARSESEAAEVSGR